MAQLPHYMLTIDDSGELGIQETSYVEYPATGLGFLAFEDEKVEHTFAKLDTQEYQRLTSGILMMPNTKYLRQTKEGNFYTVEFSAETLKNTLIQYLKQDKAGVVKVEHQGKQLNGFSAVEHWIIEDKNTKSPVLGNTLEDLGYDAEEIPAGTIMKTTYVADEKFWNEQILTGKVTGYSLGGLFELKPVEDAVQSFSAEPKMPTMEDVLKLIGVSGDNIKVTTKEGKQLQFGQTVSEDNELANGTYEFNTDLKIVVKDGVIVDFGFEQSYSNYPKAAKDNAARAVKANEELGNDCATQVGKVRAQQIIDGENLSLDTVKRTYSYLSRAKEYDNGDWTKCGTISYNLWGGDEMMNWCEGILDNLDDEDKKEKDNDKNNVEMSETATIVEPQVEVTAPVIPTETTQETVVDTNVPVIPTQTTEVNPYQSQLDEINAKMTELVAQLSDKENKISELEAKLTKLDEKNQTLKEKLKEEPIKKTQPTLPKDVVKTTPVKGKELRIGNTVVTV